MRINLKSLKIKKTSNYGPDLVVLSLEYDRGYDKYDMI